MTFDPDAFHRRCLASGCSEELADEMTEEEARDLAAVAGADALIARALAKPDRGA